MTKYVALFHYSAVRQGAFDLTPAFGPAVTALQLLRSSWKALMPATPCVGSPDSSACSARSTSELAATSLSYCLKLMLLEGGGGGGNRGNVI